VLPVKIQPGRTYTDRKGRRVIIVREMQTPEPHRFLGVTVEASGLESHDTWDEDGRCDMNGRHSPWDITHPWVGSQA
jgi:hypothetical protein